MIQKTIFICYSKADIDIAENYKTIFTNAGYKTFSGVSINPGEKYSEILSSILKKCDMIFVILTNNFVLGAWTKDTTNTILLSKYQHKVFVANHSCTTIPNYLKNHPILYNTFVSQLIIQK